MPEATRNSIDLLIDIAGEGWGGRQIDDREPLSFCLNDPDDAVEAAYLIVRNAAFDVRNVETGSFTISSSTECCR